MNWQEELISLYLFICKHYRELSYCCQRMSNHVELQLSDEEAITIYLFGLLQGHRTVKSIHRYASQHLLDWFPKLAGYAAFDHRLNQICNVFAPLVEVITAELGRRHFNTHITSLVDAMPIIMAQRGRRFHAKVAPEIASKNGYCATKKLHYYGVKLHVFACSVATSLPTPQLIGLTDASMHDRKAFELTSSCLSDNMHRCFADKAYQVENAHIHDELGITLVTPVKKEKGQDHLDAADQLFSTAVSRVRQPIEALFNWLNEKTGIQIASKVRSFKGLMVHVFGRLSAALFSMHSRCSS